jgi:hypothetical protein
MLYEMAYGVTPFFAKDIRHTYLKIMNHEVYNITPGLRILIESCCCREVYILTRQSSCHKTIRIFYVGVCLCTLTITFLTLYARLLTNRERRIGRRHVMEITEHSFFHGIDWSRLPDRE